MKTRLPKTLLIAVLAAMTQPGLAGETTTPSWTWADKTESDPINCDITINKVVPGKIINVATNETSYIKGTSEVPYEWKNATTIEDNGKYVQPYLKDGDGTLEVSGIKGTDGGLVDLNSPLYVREGKVVISDSKIKTSFGNSQLMFSVSGKNAHLELNNTTYQCGSSSTDFIGVGGPDGSGTLTLNNGTIVTAETLFAGRSRTSSYFEGYACRVINTTTAPNSTSDRYAGGIYTDTGLFYGADTNGDGVADTPRIYGKATVNVNSGATLALANIIEAAEAELNVDGGTIVAQKGIVLGRQNGTSNELNVTNGGKVLVEGASICTGDKLEDNPPSQYNTTIKVSGLGSEINVAELELGYTTKDDTDDKKSLTKLTVTDKATVTAGEIELGRTDGSRDDVGKVDVEVGPDAKLTATDTLSLLAGAKVTNSGTITVAGALTMSGGAELNLIITKLSDLPSLTVDSLTVKDDAVINLIFGKLETLESALAGAVMLSLETETAGSSALQGLIKFTSADGLANAENENITLSLSYYDTDGDVKAYKIDNTQQTIALSQVAVTVPEPTTATLSLLALAGLCARRRRR